MSVYGVAKFCRSCLLDIELRELVQSDPGAALQRFDITDQERAYLLAGEVGQLYEAGCVEFLLSYLPRWGLFGLDVTRYSDRMRAAKLRPLPTL
jgi:hypothetical protein